MTAPYVRDGGLDAEQATAVSEVSKWAASERSKEAKDFLRALVPFNVDVQKLGDRARSAVKEPDDAARAYSAVLSEFWSSVRDREIAAYRHLLRLRARSSHWLLRVATHAERKRLLRALVECTTAYERGRNEVTDRMLRG